MSRRKLRRVCVFCGSSDDVAPAYFTAARRVGQLLAEQGLGLVYGGGRTGLMGAVADAALDAGGEVLGVIPEKLMGLEVGHHRLTELFVVDSMRARKAMMAHLSSAFLSLPGGFGTMEELFEVITLTQLNYHLKPVGLLNTNHYYDHLLAFLRHAGTEGFIRPQHQTLLRVSEDPQTLISSLENCEIPQFTFQPGPRL